MPISWTLIMIDVYELMNYDYESYACFMKKMIYNYGCCWDKYQWIVKGFLTYECNHYLDA